MRRRMRIPFVAWVLVVSVISISFSLNAVAAAVPKPSVSYGSVNGFKVTYYHPATGFDPLTATNAELAANGFPIRPTNPDNFKTWMTAMRAYKQYVVPVMVPVPHARSQTVKTAGPRDARSSFSPNWSGYLLNQGQYAITQTVGTWTDSVAQTCPGNTYSSAWTGIGGWNTTSLVQDGTETDTLNGTLGCYVNTYAWWEILPANQVDFSNLTIYQGDEIFGETSVNTSNDTAYFYIGDLTTGQSTSTTVSFSSGQYDGSTGEWVVERTEESGYYPQLMDFGSDTFGNINAVDSSGASLNLTGNSTGIVLEDDAACIADSDGDEGANVIYLAVPGGYNSSGNGFTDYWYNYGDVDPHC